MFSGGITGAVQIARMARSAGLEFAPHTWNGNGIGLIANAHVCAATDATKLEFPYDPPSFVPEVRDAMLTEVIRIDPADGCLVMPTGPGLGVELDIAAVEKHGEPI